MDFLEDNNVHLTSVWNDNHLKPSHTGLVHRLNTERRSELQPVFDRLRKSRYEKIIISCEDLAAMSLEPVKVLMLRELLDDSHTTILFYVRRWSDLLFSEWREYVKQGSTLQFLEVLAHNLRNPVTSRIINIDRCLSVYAELFGRDSIKIVSYDEVLASGADVFEHFAGVFLSGLRLRLPERHRVNVSLTATQTELMRLFNLLGRESLVDSSRLLRFFYLQHPPAPLRDVLARLETFVTTIELSDYDPPVRCVLNDNRRRYDACVLPPVALDFFSEPRTLPVPFVRAEYALTPGFTEAVRRLWTALLDVEKPR